MDFQTTSSASSDGELEVSEDSKFLEAEILPAKSRPGSYHVFSLYIVILILLIQIMILSKMRVSETCKDPSLGIFSPANEAVAYIKDYRFTAALFNFTEYMDFPTDETDSLWENLYNFGTSIISKSESDLLHSPTLPIPGTENYLVQLDVFHELHCLNDLRKVFYPERYGGLDALKQNGTIDRDNREFRHWNHCIDAIRQTLMCHADISPISFHVNIPSKTGIFPRLATTHTCRNFSKIQDWAKSHSAGKFEYKFPLEQLQNIINTAGFDQAPEENIQGLWELFPGDTFFEHWRDNLLNGNN